MSTFRGVMQEFPDVRVDFFRQQKGLRPPLACFLSHVHSDHLAGLESLKSPFVYCSAATKEMLLKLERYPHQLNFELGILESRKQHYKQLQNLLKPIPLETPTCIELSPGNEIQVTLFDANHCTGAVMFLFEGQNKAVLYTGDIRSEPWFVNNLARNPFLMEYTTQMKTLDCVYLDTSNLGPYKFSTKAEGLKELLGKVAKYPADTVFHFSAWTFGYEEVWVALSRFLKSPIHVDKYKMRLYKALRAPDNTPNGSILAPEAAALTGYTCGNTPQLGCLTTDNTARIHSCGKGMNCPAINDEIVWIQPIVARTKTGLEIEEVGVGGGGGDLSQRPELDLTNPVIFQQLLQLVANDEGVSDIKAMLVTAIRSSTKVLSLDDMGFDKEEDETSLADLIKAISKAISEKKATPISQPDSTKDGLPKRITFPYSRHSSLYELRDLVDLFKPKDVYPCTVDEENWDEVYSMEYLFGPYCSDKMFRHDKEMREIQAEMPPQSTTQQTQTTNNSDPSQRMGPNFTTPPESTPNKPTNRRSAYDPKLIPIHGNPQNAAAPSVTLSQRNLSGPSVSSHLRRKAVEEEPGEDRTKRPRLDSPASALPTRAVHENSNLRLTLSDRMNHSHPVQQETTQEAPNPNVDFIESIKPTPPPNLIALRITGLNGPGEVQAVINNPADQLGQQQLRTGRAKPIGDIRMSDVAKEEIRRNINRIRMALPDASVDDARAALSECCGDIHEAVGLLADYYSVTADNQSPSEQEVEEAESEEGENPSSSQGSQGLQNLPSSGDSNASGDSHCTETPNTYESGSVFLGLKVDDYGTFNDKVDRVVRCKICTHEFWGKYPDCCTNCNPPMDSEELTDSDVEGLAFHEFQESHTELDENGLRPSLYYEINNNIRDVYGEETLISLADICEPYLDCGSSAYDSQDDDPKFAEQYETNSFIDDEEPEEESEEENTSSDDDEVDYKEKFKKLQESHRALQHHHAVTENRHVALKMDFQEFRRDVMGSDYDSEGTSDSDEMGEEGILLIDVAPLDPVVTEVVLSDSDEGAPDSLMGELRENSIKQEMSTEGESDEEGYTMVTPQNNHSMREVEL